MYGMSNSVAALNSLGLERLWCMHGVNVRALCLSIAILMPFMLTRTQNDVIIMSLNHKYQTVHSLH